MCSPSEEKENGGLNEGVGKRGAETPVISRRFSGATLAEGREESEPDGADGGELRGLGEVTSKLTARIEMMMTVCVSHSISV